MESKTWYIVGAQQILIESMNVDSHLISALKEHWAKYYCHNTHSADVETERIEGVYPQDPSDSDRLKHMLQRRGTQ